MPGARFRVGFLVNPVAGLGGRPGLKGSDDPQQIRPLLEGLEPEELPAYQRALDFLTDLLLPKGVAVSAPGPLGEDVLKQSMGCGGPIFEIVREPGWSKTLGQTTAEDTQRFARRLTREELDVLVFVGGDGTAVDVARAVENRLPILGVPAGVKMFSGVFAETPRVAQGLVKSLTKGFVTESVDVVDLDEHSYRSGRWEVRAYAHARVPVAPGVQVAKGGEIPTQDQSLQDLVAWFRETYDRDRTYILGAGTTVAAIKKSLGNGTPLGVDAYRNGRFAATDVGESALLEALDPAERATLIVSPTGRQGCVLGRGTAQISPAVVDRVGVENVVVVATPAKLTGLRDLFIDTGDAELDARFPDYIKVRTDAWTEKVFRLRKGFGDGGHGNR